MDMLWYACYGSNMDLDRFLIYLRGGNLTVNGKTKRCKPCAEDNSAPRNSEPYKIKRRFYFAKESQTWNKHGVGFISTKADKRSFTYAKLYLISVPQFNHLFSEENGGNKVQINYAALKRNKVLDFDLNFYNRIIQLDDDHEGYPVLTFTNKEIQKVNYPMQDYVQLISDGIRQTHKINTKTIKKYFNGKRIGALSKKMHNED